MRVRPIVPDERARCFVHALHAIRVRLQLTPDEMIAGLLGALTAVCEETDLDPLALLLQIRESN